MQKKKINKEKVSRISEKLKKLNEVPTINESYIMPFGQLKGLTIREAIIADFKYIDWCVREKIFILNESLQKHFNRIVDAMTYTEDETDNESLFPWD